MGVFLVVLATACASKSSAPDVGVFVHTPKEALALAKATGKPIFRSCWGRLVQALSTIA